MADQDNRQVAFFGDANQVAGNLTNLGWHAGSAVEAAVSDGLNRVDHEQVGVDRVDLAEHIREVGFGGKVEAIDDGTGALGAQAHLADRFFARNIEHAESAFGGVGGYFEKERGLAYARLTREQDDCARD